MQTYSDQLGRSVVLRHVPRRIISLVPSQTQLLHALGLEEEVVGITRFCIHPSHWFRIKTRVGGTKNVHFDQVHALQPDLILANKEENDKQQIEALASHYPVWVSDVATLPQALDMIHCVGQLTGRDQQAESLAAEIENRFQSIFPETFPLDPTPEPMGPHQPHPAHPPQTSSSHLYPNYPTLYLIWRNPWMTIGHDTFIHDMLTRCGLSNIAARQTRYPIIDLSAFASYPNLLILLSSEPYPFHQKHIDEIQSILPRATIRLVDGQTFSWYGSHLLQSPAYFRSLLYNNTPPQNNISPQ